MPDGKIEDALYVRCSDGRTKRPDNIVEKCVHQVRKAGGVLNALFKFRFSRVKMSLADREDDQLEDIETMIGLKNPKKIIVASHAHCGAAQALNLNHEDVVAHHNDWADRIRARYPNIEVEVVHEWHTECGTNREWELVASSGK